MTREEIEAMPAGREMDGLIAERFFNYTLVEYHGETVYQHPDYLKLTYHEQMSGRGKGLLQSLSGEIVGVPVPQIPAYSTDIAAAWELVAKLAAQGYFLKLVCGPNRAGASFVPVFAPATHEVESAGATAPLAICRAALLTTLA